MRLNYTQLHKDGILSRIPVHSLSPCTRVYPHVDARPNHNPQHCNTCQSNPANAISSVACNAFNNPAGASQQLGLITVVGCVSTPCTLGAYSCKKDRHSCQAQQWPGVIVVFRALAVDVNAPCRESVQPRTTFAKDSTICSSYQKSSFVRLNCSRASTHSNSCYLMWASIPRRHKPKQVVLTVRSAHDNVRFSRISYCCVSTHSYLA